MKKLLILTGIAVLAIVSCARDEIKMVNKGHAIDFKVVETKGEVIESSYEILHFYVTSFNIVQQEDGNLTASPYFTDVYFGRLGDYFSSSDAYYWPKDGTPLLFVAYTPGEEETGATATITADEQTIADFAPAANINDQVDLMTAVGYGNKENENSGVALTFKHRLARIKVSAQENNNEYEYSVTGVRLINFASKGTLDINATENEWTLEAEKATYHLEYDKTPIKSYSQTLMYTEDEEVNDALILPQTLTAWDPETDPDNEAEGAYIAIKLQIKAAASGTQIFPAVAEEYGWAAVPVPDGLTLKAGFEYQFNLNLTNGAGYRDPADLNPEDDFVEKILGNDIMFTYKVNETEVPTEGAIARKALEGNWLVKKAEIKWQYDDDYVGSTYSEFTKEGEEELKEWFQGNGFYQFVVDNNYNLTITTDSGQTIPTSFTVDDDMNIYLEALKDPATGEYPKIKIHEINEEENTCTTLVIDDDYYSGVDRYVYYTYDRN